VTTAKLIDQLERQIPDPRKSGPWRETELNAQDRRARHDAYGQARDARRAIEIELHDLEAANAPAAAVSAAGKRLMEAKRLEDAACQAAVEAERPEDRSRDTAAISAVLAKTAATLARRNHAAGFEAFRLVEQLLPVLHELAALAIVEKAYFDQNGVDPVGNRIHGLRCHLPANARLYAALDADLVRGLELWLARARERAVGTVAVT